jgi:preprotein translocase subunit SecF
MQILSNTNYNFTRWRWYALGLSAAVIIAGLAVIVSRGGLPLGIDFSGGTIVIVKFDQGVSEQQVRAAVDPIAGEEIVQQYGDPSENSWLVRLAQSQATEQGASLEAGSQ